METNETSSLDVLDAQSNVPFLIPEAGVRYPRCDHKKK